MLEYQLKLQESEIRKTPRIRNCVTVYLRIILNEWFSLQLNFRRYSSGKKDVLY